MHFSRLVRGRSKCHTNSKHSNIKIKPTYNIKVINLKLLEILNMAWFSFIKLSIKRIYICSLTECLNYCLKFARYRKSYKRLSSIFSSFYFLIFLFLYSFESNWPQKRDVVICWWALSSSFHVDWFNLNYTTFQFGYCIIQKHTRKYLLLWWCMHGLI